MDGGSIPPQDDAPVTADADEVDIRLPDDPRVPQPDDADPTVSKELGGAAPAVGPGRSAGTSGPGTDGSASDADGQRGPDGSVPAAVPDAELRTADHILSASATDTRALFEGRGLVAVDITEFEKLGGRDLPDGAHARLKSAIDV